MRRPIHQDVDRDLPDGHGHDRDVAIDYFDLLGDEGWEPAFVDRTPALLRSTKVDPAFGIESLRCLPGGVVPTRSHNVRLLTIVFGGELTVDLVEGERTDSRTVGAGQFFVLDEGTTYTLTAGATGATFIETWPPRRAAEMTTSWA